MSKTKKNYWAAGTALIIVALVVYYVGVTPEDTEQPDESGIKFYDVRTQAPEFISYYDSITLTPEQEKIKSDALSSMPAPCCEDYTMETCCCPCMFSKTVWGLSNFLIAEHNYNAEQLEDAVSRWVIFTNENGYAGDACYKGRCNIPFEEDGCGGMEKLVLGAGEVPESGANSADALSHALEKWNIAGKELSYSELETRYRELYNFTYPYIVKEEVNARTIPTGTPKIYGEELGVSFDKNANKMISILRGHENVQLSENQLERYIGIGSKISCEYCCGARTLVNPDGTRACGCAHSYAMRGLAKYLILNHPDEYSDEEILDELVKWKTLFFPKQSVQKVLNKYAETNEIDPSILLDMPNMVGSC